MTTHTPGPARVVHTRLGARADGALAEAAVDSRRTAWARVMTDGAHWSPWVQLASGAADIDVAVTTQEESKLALVAVDIAQPGHARRVFVLGSDGSVVATAL
jgi:hypothetical protein